GEPSRYVRQIVFFTYSFIYCISDHPDQLSFPTRRSSDLAAKLIADVQKALDNEIFSVHPSVSFRNILLWHGGPLDTIFDPAHEIMGERIGDHLPQGSGADAAIDYMKKTHEILKNHPNNQEKIAKVEL